MKAIMTRTTIPGVEIEVTIGGMLPRRYLYQANRFGSIQDSHAAAAMAYVRDTGLRVDYAEWHAGELAAGFVFVWTDSHMNKYQSTFKIDPSGECKQQ